LITLWDTTEFVCRKTFDRAAGPVKTLSFSYDGTYLVGGSDEGSGLEVINVETGEYVYKIDTTGKVPCVEWSPRDYSLAYAPTDGGGGLKIVGSFGST
jgi:THO complex subunit 3